MQKKRTRRETVCSPTASSPALSGKCLSAEDYRRVAQAIHSPTVDRTRLMRQTRCSNERCLVRRAASVNPRLRTLENLFAPIQSESWKKNPYEWLSNIEIETAIKPWLKKYPDAALVDVTSLDWNWTYPNGQCESPTMCSFNLNDYLRQGKYKIGIVQNLDKHDGPGSHWVALFICAKSKTIYYFDSTGHTCPKHILAFVDKVRAQSGFNFRQNRVSHQLGNTECGVYCIYFLTHMIKSGNFDHFKQRIPDKTMKRYRSIFFSPV